VIELFILHSWRQSKTPSFEDGVFNTASVPLTRLEAEETPLDGHRQPVSGRRFFGDSLLQRRCALLLPVCASHGLCGWARRGRDIVLNLKTDFVKPGSGQPEDARHSTEYSPLNRASVLGCPSGLPTIHHREVLPIEAYNIFCMSPLLGGGRDLESSGFA